MGKKDIRRITKKSAAVSSRQRTTKRKSFVPWLLTLIVITAFCFLPMLKNEFTNWDDEYYVINNPLLRGPDWKGIFTQQVVGNYHPLTVLTLAFNYSLTALDPSSYLIFNLILHLLNCSLVFYFI